MRYLLLFVLLLGNVSATLSDPKPTLVYIFDPLCSWCYLFSPVIEQIQLKYKGQIEFSVVSGGMIPASKAKPISLMQEFIFSGREEMEQLTSTSFGAPYLELVNKGTDTLCSEKPSFAFVAFRHLRQEQSISFAGELQKSHFQNGLSYSSNYTYVRLAQIFGLDTAEFLNSMQSDSIQSVARKEFARTDSAGISSFPNLLFRQNNKVYTLAEGFQSFDKLDSKLEKLLKKR